MHFIVYHVLLTIGIKMTTSKDATKKEAPWKTFGSLGEFKEAWGKGTVKEEKLNVPSNLALSGVKSVARTYNIPFEAARFYTLKIDLGGRVVAFDWQAPANLYNNYFVGLKNVVINSKTDFTRGT